MDVWLLLSFLLLVEDAGLLEGVLALGDVPHSDRTVAAAGGQQSLLIGPAAGDNLIKTNMRRLKNVYMN